MTETQTRTDEPTVLTERTGSVLVVTLDRPPARMEGIVAFLERRKPSWTAS